MARHLRSAVRLLLPSGLWPLASGLLTACTHDLQLIQGPDSVAMTTTGPWASMIYLARTDSGVIAIDLGWTGAEGKLKEGLARLGATPADVRWVFLTHAHRDHVAGWPLVRQARFVLGAAEVPFFEGAKRYEASLPRVGDELVSAEYPEAGALSITALGADTVIALGHDTVAAFMVPGHTPGSTAYLFRGILFGGDAVNWRPVTGFRGARPEFSESVQRSHASMRALWNRLPPWKVRVLCSAHAKCAVADQAIRRVTAQ